MTIRTWCAALAALVLSLAPAQAQEPNILLVIADDLGVDILDAYGLGNDRPPTPTIDALAAEGILFRNAWANPMCSPTRATILTGRYSFRTHIGTIVSHLGTDLSPQELSIPRMLDVHDTGYRHAAFGKWHLGKPSNPATHPNDLGFGHFSGARENFPQTQSYYSWAKVVDGAESPCTQYATTVNVDDALAWIAAGPEPWLCWLAFNAPHSPFHAPPPDLHSIELPNVDPREQPRPFYKAMVQALDAELGRLLASLDPEVRARTYVIFVGDNGTPKEVVVPPFDKKKAKLTPYEGGLRVPLLVSGPQIVDAGRQVTALVNTTDLFATILELAGVDSLAGHPATLDSVSLVPYFTQPALASLRAHAYAEIFVPNGEGPYEADIRAIRGPRFKLIRRGGTPAQDELYDVLFDPFELRDLIKIHGVTNLPLDARIALGQLRNALVALLASS